MYVNYCIWLEVILWSWISAELQVGSVLPANHRTGSLLLYGETRIILFSFIHFVYQACKLCSDVFDVFMSTNVQFGVCLREQSRVSESR